MILSLEVKQARKGDCLLLHYGTDADRHLLLIDGGPKKVYARSLKPRLLQLAGPAGAGLIVDVLMVSHVDDDHIQGILDLTKEERDAMLDGKPRLLNVLSLWHNSYDDLIGSKADKVVETVTEHLGEAGLKGMIPDDRIDEILESSDTDDAEVIEAGIGVLASIPQGHKLRDDAEFLSWGLNVEVGGGTIAASSDELALDGELEIKVVGPLPDELAAFKKKYDEWLLEKAKGQKNAVAQLASYVDESVTNLSSIVVIVTVGAKNILLTGDARGDKILEGLEKIDVLKKGGTMEVDILKVPHHGSSNNLDTGFFERILADHYVFSGDGEHGNPERETLEMLFAARRVEKFTIHLTYEVSAIDVERKKEWEKQRLREIKNKSAKPSAPNPRPEWDHDLHSLTALLAEPRTKNATVAIVGPKRNHIIDLLDPVRY